MALVCARATSLPAQKFRQSSITKPFEEWSGYIPDASDEPFRRQPAPPRVPSGWRGCQLVGAAGLGAQAGLTNDWTARVVRQDGNYGEVFARDIGTATRLGVARGSITSKSPEDSLTPHPSAQKRLTRQTPPPGTKQRM